MEISQLLDKTLDLGASDLHISSGLVPMVRIDGEIQKLDTNLEILSIDEFKKLIAEILNKEQLDFYYQYKEIDLSFDYKNKSRFRVNIFTTQKGLAAVFRVIPNKIISLEELNAPPVFKKLCLAPKGLVLVTGPTGSGKSTTLAAMINYINTTRKLHILTIEDPIEFIHKPNLCIINQRENKKHTHSFENALKSALREDPDIILVGEMRDLETIRLALTAAETGHLVFATLHTTGAARTVDRIVDVFPGNEKDLIRKLLSESLNAVISQVLIKKLSGKGRIAAHEILICTGAIRNLIRENKIPQITSSIQTGMQFGMQTLEHSLNQLVQTNKITIEEANSKLNTILY